ncbi:uncharacterized protein LOC132637445 [Lycium barbarum]|uniref:uncharacterized protein LOC132637445 n=1 Tax=Lycium barbarum TaxID=112863 RepID=UPI00293E8897|nr:uncharacterized protein LOC132637445 [Lycium barbarum]
MRQEHSIQVTFVNPDNKSKLEHKIHLKASIDVVRLLLNQGLTFRGHREDESSLNKGNFLEILSWYAKRLGSVVEWFIGIIHVRDTSALCLKVAIVNYLAQHSLSLSHIRGQCYIGASKMQGRLSGVKTLIQQESISTHAIHFFAHQLQLALVGVSKKCLQVEEPVLLVSNVLNVLGGFFKCMDELRESQEEKVQEALDMGEVETDKGLNQELGLARAANTRWGSHYKYFKNFISMFDSITDVLDTIVVDSECVKDRAKAIGFLRVCQTFEIAFILQLMRDILAITIELNESLQKKEQDIANGMLLVQVVKKRLQDLRDEGWDLLIERSAFSVKLLIGNFKNKLKECFNEVRTNLLIGVVCLNPVDTFSSFNIEKILRMVELYPDDFGENIMVTLKNELETYIADVCDVDGRFSNLKGLGNHSEELVKAQKHLHYPLVFRLVKFALFLPVATATVERAFSPMKLIKNELRNRMIDDFMSGSITEMPSFFDFPPKLSKIIMSCISTSSIAVLVNGGKTTSIQPTRGIRQGDPMSPYIFILCMELLSRRIEQRVSQNDWTPISVSARRPKISHLFFTDDLTLFSQANNRNVNTILETLSGFSSKSGQRINFIK